MAIKIQQKGTKQSDKNYTRQRKLIRDVLKEKSLPQIAANNNLPQEKVAQFLYNKVDDNDVLGLALETQGLTDEHIAKVLKKTLKGAGVRATNGDAIRGIELLAKLKGKMKDAPTTVNNTYINELKVLSVGELESRALSLAREIERIRNDV